MARKLLNGNYDLEKNPETTTTHEKSYNEFEKAALEHLGGSIAFIRGGILYDENN